jgi:membrane associated rhomboid family serine protease
VSTLPAKPADPAPLNRVVPPNPKQAAFVVLGFTALMYLIELIDVALPVQLDRWGIAARSWSGLDGVIWAPLLHASWDHLLSNTVPVLVFGRTARRPADLLAGAPFRGARRCTDRMAHLASH